MTMARCCAPLQPVCNVSTAVSLMSIDIELLFSPAKRQQLLKIITHQGAAEDLLKMPLELHLSHRELWKNEYKIGKIDFLNLLKHLKPRQCRSVPDLNLRRIQLKDAHAQQAIPNQGIT